MNTLDILNGLQDYITLLSTIKEHEEINFPALKNPTRQFVKTVSLSYSFITLQLDIKKEEEEADNLELYLKCVFQINRDKVTLTEVYCNKREHQDEIKKFIVDHAPVTNFPESTNFNNYSKETLSYFPVVDEIAKQAYNCSSGDNYRPGFFSAIIVGETGIILEQINHWNAKSSDHKKDYHLRNLEFYIPLSPIAKPMFNDYEIGKMQIHFIDNSSKNNKDCGDRIMEKLLEEKAKFEKP